jgi:branched-chain amino acid transport system ATP-binding protein
MPLEVRRLVSGYNRDVPILNGVDVTAEDGRVTLVIGPNGAGKSTLLRTIYGYLTPFAGEIKLAERPLAGLRPRDMLKAGIAYLLQGHSVFPAMTVEENLELGGWIMKGDRQALEQAFTEVYQRFPILKQKRRAPSGFLSGGERRMLEIARLTMTRPKVLLLDEPSVGLMPKLVDEVYAEIAKLKDERFTILIVDQNIRKAMEIADYVYVLKLGENSKEGPKAEFQNNYSSIVKDWL